MTNAKNSPAPASAASGIETAIALLKDGRVAAAEAAALAHLRGRPDSGEGLYVLAVCQRYLGRLDDALATLKSLQAQRPAFGRAWQEEGHLHSAAGRTAEARVAYLHAVALNNSLLASWNALLALARESGDRAMFNEAREQQTRLAALPPELLSVRNMISEGKLFKAEQLCRDFLQRHPRQVEGMRLLADLGVRAQVLDDAEFLLESAVEFEPHNRFARFDYMNVLYRRQKYAQSLAQARRLRDADPDNPEYRVAYANQCVAVGDFDAALAIYDDVAAQLPGNPLLHLVRGHALKTIGRLDDAIDSYRRAYTARADFGDAFWSLANLKTYRFTAAEMDAMRAAEAAATTRLEDRIHLCFALGKAYEDADDIARAAQLYLRGNALKKDELRYSAQRMSERLALQREVCTPALFAAHAGHGCSRPDPIFIVGLPRAGSTLLEQILASHSQVDGTLELPNISALAAHLDGRRTTNDEPRYPAVLHELTADKLREFGEAFLADTQIHRRGAPFFIDKMPNNFRHIGLIRLILPNAKIIDARRHPMACCFSGFKQLFANGQEFTYGLPEIGRYYRDYVELMDHWDAALPGSILRVHYEDVVADVDAQVRRLLAFCDLPFEQACVDFHQTQRSVRTPSSEQVRQPIFTAGLEQWRRFEPYLEPLKDALGPVLERYPIAPAHAAN